MIRTEDKVDGERAIERLEEFYDHEMRFDVDERRAFLRLWGGQSDLARLEPVLF